ncbi:hypothetical protein [Chryseobacterium indoltheticum]|uniref:Uncharacterized protein n=1 Tax=Chryseobacterium indoltheticum TaxID=254 RepID=A0A381JT69_9FLAO|nr:hypothetical protein [Chryseobacterium indoltheticum]AZA75606.1 hypothetical protein EG358_18470 [Chryseobacterium indoltheticum]SIQ44539.1 hypothetical protein SAMN05421682_10553 [Chryseobacterium indoltheticum]SUY53734.1 Uncharacterised protein [Chryseobacterium indoltheticum]
MVISKEIKEGLNTILNEAAIINIEFNEIENYICCKFDLLRESDNETPNITNFKFENVFRFVAKYSEKAGNIIKVKKITPNEISSYVDKFINKDIYGWNFINVEKSNFNFKNCSFDYIKCQSYDNHDSIELFQEDLNEDIEMKIWFEKFEIYNELYQKINIEDLILKQNKIWDSIF